jgi:aryl-alcohol dehydrogenase-like predicted oxidoreductase
MRYKLLGRTGLRVSEAALGSGTFGTAWGWGADRQTCKTLFDAYADVGGNFIDTASGYQDGEAETIVGEFLKSERANFVVNTKYSGPAFKGAGVAATGNSRKAMMQSLESSLRRLGTDYVDIFMVHFSDGLTPMEEIVRGFEDLVRAGKVNYVGFSDFPAWRVARGATLAQLSGLPVAAIQMEFSLVERTAERELLPMAEGLGLGVTLWSVLGGGLLSGKYRTAGVEGRLSRGGGTVREEGGEREHAILNAVEAVAGEAGATPAQVAIAWARARAARWNTAIIPILGARTLEQLRENLGGLDLELTESQVQRLDELSAVSLGFPHDLLNSDMIHRLGSAGRWDQIDRPRYSIG